MKLQNRVQHPPTLFFLLKGTDVAIRFHGPKLSKTRPWEVYRKIANVLIYGQQRNRNELEVACIDPKKIIMSSVMPSASNEKRR